MSSGAPVDASGQTDACADRASDPSDGAVVLVDEPNAIGLPSSRGVLTIIAGYR
ncbi:hypothetical protein [Halorussus halobius]|uniref:hypothetical protein n=1 Tax=Halorussus halobius TaxID=1710537 RepID=UPI00143DD797|nr:hypothetical protein [Halorussus halobius]